MTEPAPAAEPLLRVRGVEKRYAVPVLTAVDFDLHAGEVHALIGANGAGKSTLARVVCGLTRPDRGTMMLGGDDYAPRSRRDAERAGVQVVLQELNLIPTLSVGENLFLNELPHRWGLISFASLHAKSAAALRAVGLGDLDPATLVRCLGIGHQQLIEIAAALARRCRLLVLDEPTAALTDAEIERLFIHLRRLRAGGAAILYVSHRLDEIQRIADRITVLRDGRIVSTKPAANAQMDEVVSMMVGERVVDTLRPHEHPKGDVAMSVAGLSRGSRVRGVSFEVRRGEILGLAGLVGAGRTETLRAIFGADTPDEGTISRGASPLRMRGPWDAVRSGIGMVPEDRKQHALLHSQPVRVNMTLAVLPVLTRARWWIAGRSEAASANDMRARLDIRSRSIEQPVRELSGGNQQKIVIARWLLRDCDVLLFDEPTRGIDVAAKAAVYRMLHELAARGKAIVLVSSELPELIALCDRIAVMSAGRLVATFTRPEWSEEAIMAAAFK
jgi:ribose transport system ATP-binding protein